jgi:hypothetical protein
VWFGFQRNSTTQIVYLTSAEQKSRRNFVFRPLKRRLSGNFFAKRILIDVYIGATLQIGHDWTIDFLVKEFDSH